MKRISNNLQQSYADNSRIRSIDVTRGLIILVMLFVNDVAGVFGVPACMKHFYPALSDGMTFVDVVFPAFLFIMGLSLPMAIENRFKHGSSLFSVIGHIIVRVLSLLIIGVLMVNTENISHNGLISPDIWKVLLSIGICLIWISLPNDSTIFIHIRRYIGIFLLTVLAIIYRGEPDLIWFRTKWWGILGLLGWAYLINAFIYLLFRRKYAWYIFAIIFLYGLCLADAEKFFSFPGEFNRWIHIGPVFGSHGAITAAGVLLGVILMTDSNRHVVCVISTLIMAAVFGASAVMLHLMNGMHMIFTYNKILATLPWGLLSSAITSLIFVLVYIIADIIKPRFGLRILDLAGQNALFAFNFEFLFYTILSLFHNLFPDFYTWGWLGRSFETGLYRALIFSMAGTFVTAQLRKKGVFLKL